MTEPFMGAIVPMAFNFAPIGWMSCEGQMLSIQQNTALFALLGTMYGGNGVQTFALPDLRGRSIVGQGQGPGLADYQVGEQGGLETVAILTSNLPMHTHAITVNVNGNSSTSNDPTNNYFGGNGPLAYETSQDGTTMNPAAVTAGITGSSVPLDILTPYLAMYYNIATEGLFPSRN